MMMIDKDTGLMTRPNTPWHLWLVGILAVLWNSIGALDFVMTQVQHEDYMANFTDAQKTFFYSMPIWAVAAWAAGVWAAFIGSVLLLLRSRFAVVAFIASLVGMAVSFSHNLAAGSLELMGGPVYLIMTAVIVVIGVALSLSVFALDA